ncbi:MAG TPA: hypothetical protein VHB77_17360 [Planctomycetaceae bacterium]|nr:hypothetical protein [Planctomycetaceae bacterium]
MLNSRRFGILAPLIAAWVIGSACCAPAAETTRLGVQGERFTINDAPVFLLGCSYYGGLGADAATWQADLRDLQRAGINWIRVWATWGAFGRDVSAIDAEGNARQPYLDRLKSLVADCDRRGIVVDVTLSRGNGATGPARLQTLEAHRRAVETIVMTLKPWRNWYLDLGNERNIRDARFVSVEDLRALRAGVRELDADRLVTASHGGDIGDGELRNYVTDIGVDFICPHRPRDKGSPAQTEPVSRQLRQRMQSLGRVVPVHFQEPFRRGYADVAPASADYLTDLRGAIAAGAAGWCFHNGATRGAPHEEPRRSFDLSEKRLFDQLDGVERDALPRLHELIPAPEAEAFHVRPARLADLGSEHLAHAISRRTAEGVSIVAWGERIVEWPLKDPRLHEVVPRQNGTEYSNGGCALDVDGDGVDEIVVARGRSRSCSDPDLLWFQQTNADAPWTSHHIGHIGNGPVAPHDVNPFSALLPDGRKVRGVVAVIDRQKLVWYEIPADPQQPWPIHEIATLPVKSQSGIAVGNLAGNGRSDVACGMFWAECPADPLKEPWKVRRYGHWEDGGWGGMDKLELADINGDGQLEIVASEAEIPSARLGIFSRDPAQPEARWKCREIEAGLYCPHSLVLTDLDGDGKTDMIIGEMKAGGWSFPLNPEPRILAFLNRGDRPFERHVLAEGVGVHEMGSIADQQKGTLVLFAADEIQQRFPEMKTHVTTWTIELPNRKAER